MFYEFGKNIDWNENIILYVMFDVVLYFSVLTQYLLIFKAWKTG